MTMGGQIQATFVSPLRSSYSCRWIWEWCEEMKLWICHFMSRTCRRFQSWTPDWGAGHILHTPV